MNFIPQQSHRFPHTVLIIEDDQLCRYVHDMILSELVSKVDIAENVKEAFEKLAAKHYDLVISDIGLPDGTGKDIVKKIKATPDSPNYRTPFVAISAQSDIANHEQAMDAGFLIVGVKPLTEEKAEIFLETYPIGFVD